VSQMFGLVVSPLFPQGYPDNVLETWDIAVPPGYAIQLHLTHLDIENSENCEYDFLKVSVDGMVLSTFCGEKSSSELRSTVNPALYSTLGSMRLTFQSDFSNTERHTGFSAYYFAVDINECDDPYTGCSHDCSNYIGGYYCSCQPGYLLQEDNTTCAVNCSGEVFSSLLGSISSPSYPSLYPENSACSYSLQVEEGFQLVLAFEGVFDIEMGERAACVDSLRIRAGGREWGPYCGNVAPKDPVVTNSNHAEVLFNTDGYGANKGWKIKYTTKAKTCPNFLTENSVLEPKRLVHQFKDHVRVTCNKGYEIVIVRDGYIVITVPLKGQYLKVFDHPELESILNKECFILCLNVPAVDCGPPKEIDNANLKFIRESSPTTYQSQVYYECEAPYYKINIDGKPQFTCEADGMWRSSDGKLDIPHCIPGSNNNNNNNNNNNVTQIPYFFLLSLSSVCGKPSKPLESIQRIFGGKPAQLGNVPWQVFFQSPRGGGVLISDRWVLTVAHMAEVDQPLIYMGFLDARKLEQGVKLEVEKMILHPAYKRHFGDSPQYNYDNDIALIKLKGKVKMGPNVTPICLPQTKEEGQPELGKIGFISGWGRVKPRQAGKMPVSPVLLYAGIPVAKTQSCADVKPMGSEIQKEKFVITDNMFCAGMSGVDSCQGDSGGGYVFQGEDSVFQLKGLVSWGIECGSYGFYTKVANYLDWIRDTMAANKD
ncbi:C1S protein, partial [Polyodon spathula]|nr:C1S protein [Polyodon spathula]